MKHLICIGSLVLCLLLTACGGGTPAAGGIKGRLVGSESGKPLEKAQVILCLAAAEGSAEVCTLQAAPTVQTDATGAFQLDGVPAGKYYLLYALPAELKLSADKWGGLKLTRGATCMKSSKNAICKPDKEADGGFWQDGGAYVGNNNISKGATKFDDEAKYSPVGAKFTSGEGGLFLFQGAARSDFTGISFGVEAAKLAPQVQVNGGAVSEVEWKVLGR
jgi:hypothetical protein